MNDRQEWRNAVRDSGLGSSAKLVALILDTYMSAAGVAWPSQLTLAADCQLNARTIRRAVDRLERDGFVTVKRGRGRGHVSVYQATLEKGAKTTLAARKGDKPTPEKGTQTTVKGVVSAPRTRKELVINKGKRKTKTNGNLEHVQVDQAMLDLAKGWLAK